MIRHKISIGLGSLLVGLFLFSQQVDAQSTHTLKPTPKTVAWGY